MPNDKKANPEKTTAKTRHKLSDILYCPEFSTIFDVYRDEKDGQFKIYAAYSVPGNAESMNEIDLREVPFEDIYEIMRIALDKMALDKSEGVIMELRDKKNVLYFS